MFEKIEFAVKLGPAESGPYRSRFALCLQFRFGDAIILLRSAEPALPGHSRWNAQRRQNEARQQHVAGNYGKQNEKFRTHTFRYINQSR